MGSAACRDNIHYQFQPVIRTDPVPRSIAVGVPLSPALVSNNIYHFHLCEDLGSSHQASMPSDLTPTAYHRHAHSDPLSLRGSSLTPVVEYATTLPGTYHAGHRRVGQARQTGSWQLHPRGISTVSGLPDDLNLVQLHHSWIQREEEPMRVAALDSDDHETATIWARYDDEASATRADVPKLDGTLRPNTIHAELKSFFSERPDAVLQESAKAQRMRKNTQKYQITPQDRVEFAALVTARPKDYDLIRRAVAVRKFITEKEAGRLPIIFDIPGLDPEDYGGKAELDLVLAEKGILTNQTLEHLYGVGFEDLKSLKNSSREFCEVLEEYCLVQMILPPVDYEPLVNPLLANLCTATRDFAKSTGHSSSAGNRRKRAIEALKQALTRVF
ncbi:hypothetical protein GQ53DRAFT_825431 [Thozetella sp. PMI_491]|nr:hypothetical protein GQ53DRAFT_825431 [Thozetella sp. PMI_491]